MKEKIKTWDTDEALKHSHDDQMREAIPHAEQQVPPQGSYAAYVLFNLEAADAEGHAILAIGPVGGSLETYSFYRPGTQKEAPAIMACLRDPMTFTQIENASGWIVHGQPGNWWNEHVNAALALWCDDSAYQAIRECAEKTRKNPGTYNLITRNCITFVEEALEAGGVALVDEAGLKLKSIVPKDAFRKAKGTRGAQKLGAWKYWFPITTAPDNGLRSISDEPGQDAPLS